MSDMRPTGVKAPLRWLMPIPIIWGCAQIAGGLGLLDPLFLYLDPSPAPPSPLRDGFNILFGRVVLLAGVAGLAMPRSR
jgi:hypothetical protein